MEKTPTFLSSSHEEIYCLIRAPEGRNGEEKKIYGKTLVGLFLMQ